MLLQRARTETKWCATKHRGNKPCALAIYRDAPGNQSFLNSARRLRAYYPHSGNKFEQTLRLDFAERKKGSIVNNILHGFIGFLMWAGDVRDKPTLMGLPPVPNGMGRTVSHLSFFVFTTP